MSAFYDKGLERFSTGAIDLSSHDIRVRLMRTSAYTFSASHEYASSLPSALVTDVSLASKAESLGTFDAADATFSSVPSGAAINCLALFRWVSTAANSPLIAYLDGFSVTPNGLNITVSWQNVSPYIFKL